MILLKTSKVSLRKKPCKLKPTRRYIKSNLDKSPTVGWHKNHPRHVPQLQLAKRRYRRIPIDKSIGGRCRGGGRGREKVLSLCTHARRCLLYYSSSCHYNGERPSDPTLCPRPYVPSLFVFFDPARSNTFLDAFSRSTFL